MSRLLLALLICGTFRHVASRSHDTLSAESYPISVTELPTACNDLEDGYHWIRPSAELPNVYVLCDAGYTMLDPSLFDIANYHHIKALFTSYSDITDFVASSSLNDHVTWAEWLLPADPATTQWAVSEDCTHCTETEEYGDHSTYYMTGNYNGCLWVTKGYCDMDPDTLECYECTAPFVDEPVSGLCTHMYRDAEHPVNSEHDDCVGSSFNADPSIGTEGEYCVCYKPATSEVIAAGKWVLPVSKKHAPQHKDTVIEIYAEDFAAGTYRVTQPGIYRLQEDIELSMNAIKTDSDMSPNAEGAWYPRREQEHHYMGAGGTFIGPYGMGFFAGFAIEADDVTIDLNGHSLAMSKELHLQQRWFAIIEIGSKAFISGQGPGNFGPYMVTANNVIIQNGVIGLSSHHGIHGNDINNIEIRNVQIRDFEVAGIALNGFVNLRIADVDVGPVYTAVPVMGVYGQARIMLPRLREVVRENPSGTVRFAGRGHGKSQVTMSQVVDELVAQMDLVFDHVIHEVAFDDMDEPEERITQARKTFINEAGLPSSSTVYGIFLNAYGASVFGVGGSPGQSENAILQNVTIHGLYKDPWEVPRIVLTKGPFNDIMDLSRVTDDALESTRSRYVGSAYTDAQYALHKLSADWGVLGHSVVGNKVDTWISSGKSMGSAKVRCNGDIMLHVTKGVFGLRIDNVQNVEVTDLEVFDLQNVGALGSYVCGHYDSTNNGGHRNQNFPLQRGYTGTEVHAISAIASSGSIDRVKVRDIVSARGDAFGIQFFPGNVFKIGGYVSIENVHAGAALGKNVLPSLENHMPNKIPRACAVDVWTYTDEESFPVGNRIEWVDKEKMRAKCLTTHTYCGNSQYDHEALGGGIEQCDGEVEVRELFSDKMWRVMERQKEPSWRVRGGEVVGVEWMPMSVSVVVGTMMVLAVMVMVVVRWCRASKGVDGRLRFDDDDDA